MEALVRLERQNSVAQITLSRPEKRNALKRETLEQLNAHVRTLQNDESVRVVVLAAEGGVFCAGMDLGEMQQRAESANRSQEWQRDSEVYQEALSTLFNLPVPTIAAMNGPALAGGVGLVLACDLVVASRDVFFMLPEPARGITAAMVTPLLIHRVGAGAASSLLLSGERWSAERAHALGLCHALTEPNGVTPRVNDLVTSVLAGSREAYAISKQHLQNMMPERMSDMLQESMLVSAKARESADAREGLQAFLEKRPPGWQPTP